MKNISSGYGERYKREKKQYYQHHKLKGYFNPEYYAI